MHRLLQPNRDARVAPRLTRDAEAAREIPLDFISHGLWPSIRAPIRNKSPLIGFHLRHY